MSLKTLTLSEASAKLRNAGMRISAQTVADGIEQGYFDFGHLIARYGKLKRKFVIYACDSDKWNETKASQYT